MDIKQVDQVNKEIFEDIVLEDEVFEGNDAFEKVITPEALGWEEWEDVTLWEDEYVYVYDYMRYKANSGQHSPMSVCGDFEIDVDLFNEIVAEKLRQHQLLVVA